MNKIKEIKELIPYLIPASIVVLLIVAFLSQVLPTAKELEPGAKVLLEMSGNL